jgi:predicted regulator of Ras-like GTPase activity (Roadblock/LC7/MglB family)
MMMNEILSALRDVDGVHGSFVVNKSGRLVGKDLPAMFDDPVLNEVGRRIARLNEGLSAGGQDFDSCVMRFADHKLYLRSVPHGFLCVLSNNVVNTPALKMALTLTSRRIDPMITDGVALSPSVIPPSVTSTQVVPAERERASEPPARKLIATYRGHRT